MSNGRTVIAIGDSITYGQHLEHPDVPWPLLLNNYYVHSAGVPGDTTRLGLERFPRDVQVMLDASSSLTKIVIIQFGHNDCNRWQTDAGLPRVSAMAYKANLTEMVDRVRTFGAQPYLCSLTVSHRSEEHAIDVARYNSILLRVADDEDVPVIDVREALREVEDLMTDGLHLSPQGHRKYAETVLHALATHDRVHGAFV